MKKQFESKKKVTAIGVPDAQIISKKSTISLVQIFFFRKKFRQYLETIMVSPKILWMGAQKIEIQKS